VGSDQVASKVGWGTGGVHYENRGHAALYASVHTHCQTNLTVSRSTTDLSQPWLCIRFACETASALAM